MLGGRGSGERDEAGGASVSEKTVSLISTSNHNETLTNFRIRKWCTDAVAFSCGRIFPRVRLQIHMEYMN